MTPDKKIELLADADLLTERQAQIYVLREIEGIRGKAVADELGIGESTVSLAVGEAEQKINTARATVDALERIENQLSSDA